MYSGSHAMAWVLLHLFTGILSALILRHSIAVPRLNRNTKHNTLIVIYKTMRILWIDTIKFPLFLFSQEAKFYSNVSSVGR